MSAKRNCEGTEEQASLVGTLHPCELRAVAVRGEEHWGRCDPVLLADGSACAFPAVRQQVDLWIGVIGMLRTECCRMEESRKCTFT